MTPPLHVTVLPAPPSAPPLLFLRGLPAEPGRPRAATRILDRLLLRGATPTNRVFAAGRPLGLTDAATLPTIAALYAGALRSRFDGPVTLLGTSTGASVALQLAADHPDLVARLVVVAGAGRLSERGRDIQERWAERLASGCVRARDREGLVALIRAENAFDLGDRARRIAAPALVVSGGRDVFYPPELAAETVRGMPDARHLVYRGRTHAGVAFDPWLGRDVRRFLAG